MSLIAKFRLSSPLLPLVDVAAAEGTELQVEELLTTDPDGPVVVCWVEPSSFEGFEASLEAGGVESYSVLEAGSGRRLYHVRLDEPPLFPLKEAFDAVGATPYGGTVIRREGWTGRARFPNRDAIVAFRRACEEHRVSFHLESLYEANYGDRLRSGLTSKQREALALAYESGYYEVPRRASLGDLSERLGISKPSLSSRLRRAEQHVIGGVVEAD